MLLFSSMTAQRRIVAHCVKWVGVRLGLLGVVLAGAAIEQQASPVENARATNTATEPETVVLLHGMGRSRASMVVLGKRLRKAGYHTLNFPYRTADKSLDEITGELRAFVKAHVHTKRYHLVTHSLGGVIVRNGFKDGGLPRGLGRIVMLAPPNHPAELARIFRNNLVYRWITGDAGQRLGSEEFYAGLPVPSVEFGVIAGTRGQCISFDKPNDGLVSVEGTKLEGMKDFLELRHAHTLIMNHRDTAEAVTEFLRTGRFSRPLEGRPPP